MHKFVLDTRGLFALAKRRGLLGYGTPDFGYITHCALGELFGELAPKPFMLPGDQEQQTPRSTSGVVRVLGYSTADREALVEHAQHFADPDIFEICRFDELASKLMPASWTPGAQLGFEVRVCPVSRGATIPGTDRKGEVDAYSNACRKAGNDNVEREVVYRRWLENQFVTRGGAKVVEAEMTRFFRRSQTRRTHAGTRKAHRSERPDATFGGVLEITDNNAFSQTLARGIGRHRSFGFGMLLLRPVRRRGL